MKFSDRGEAAVKRGMIVSRKLMLPLAVALSICSFLAVVTVASANPLGTVTNYKTAVFLLQFNDEPTPATTEADVREHLFDGANSGNALYLESSWGRVGLTGLVNPDGDVFGYLTIPTPKPANNCHPAGGNITNGIDAIAEQQGIEVDSYDRIVYVIPSCSARAFGGDGRVWLLGDTLRDPLFLAHEFSHSFLIGTQNTGFQHAGAWQCTEGPLGSFPAAISTTCQNREYADPWDFMGSSVGRQPSIHNRVKLGFLPMSVSSDVTTEQVYDIFPTSEEPQEGRTYNLRIPLIDEPDSVTPSSSAPVNEPHELAFLNLEYRRPTGHFDANLGVSESRLGAQIRVSRDFDREITGQSNGTMVLDTDQHTRPMRGYSEMFEPLIDDYLFLDDQSNEAYDALNEDTGFYDPQNDVLLSVVERDESKISVKYSKGLLASEKTRVEIVGDELQITAQPGYANDLFIRESGNTVSVREANAPVAVGAGCTSAEKHIAHCLRSAISRVVISTGDRRDYVDMKLPSVQSDIDSGDGDDVISVAPSWTADELDCGSGIDMAFADDDNTLTSCEDPTVLSTEISAGPAWKSSDDTPTFEFGSSSEAVTFECNATLLGAPENWTSCEDQLQLGPLADGHYLLQVRATNGDGWTDQTPAAQTYYVDTESPAVAITSPADGSSTSDTTPSLTYSASDLLGHSETCSIDGGTYSACPSELPALAPGPHFVAVRSVDEIDQVTTVVSNFMVLAPPTLGVQLAAMPGTSINLTAVGGSDWVHWGRVTASTVDRKAGGNQISDATQLPGGGTVARVTSAIHTYYWSDGESPASGSTASAINVGGAINRGFSLSAPASNSQLRTLKLYVGALATTGKLTVSLSDGSMPEVVNTSVSTSSWYTALHRILTVTYRSASPSATLNVDWRQNTTSSLGRVYLHSAALSAT